jgi:FMN-dependent NADH-azoreductase
MKRILFIHSSLFDEDSASTQIGQSLVERMVGENPGSDVTRIDLANNALPHLGADEFNSWATPADQRDQTQIALATRSDKLIEQLLSHDTLVLAVPMYNLGIPSTLKAWIDRVSRAGKTFRYTNEGPVGMIEGMHAYLVFARGGIYRDTPLDTQTSYLTSVLGLMGIESIDTIFAEGLNMGEETRNKSLVDALAYVGELIGGSYTNQNWSHTRVV